MTECQMCRQPIRVSTDPVPKTLQSITDSWWFKYHVDWVESVHLHRMLAQNHNTRVRSLGHGLLMRGLFEGHLSYGAAFKLWENLTEPLWRGKMHGIGRLLLVQIGYSIVGWLFGDQYPECFILKLLLGHSVFKHPRLVSIAVDFVFWAGCLLDIQGLVLNARPRVMSLDDYVCVVSLMRILTLAFRLRGCVVLLLLNALAYSLVVALLIIYGVLARRGA